MNRSGKGNGKTLRRVGLWLMAIALLVANVDFIIAPLIAPIQEIRGFKVEWWMKVTFIIAVANLELLAWYKFGPELKRVTAIIWRWAGRRFAKSGSSSAGLHKRAARAIVIFIGRLMNIAIIGPAMWGGRWIIVRMGEILKFLLWRRSFFWLGAVAALIFAPGARVTWAIGCGVAKRPWRELLAAMVVNTLHAAALFGAWTALFSVIFR